MSAFLHPGSHAQDALLGSIAVACVVVGAALELGNLRVWAARERIFLAWLVLLVLGLTGIGLAWVPKAPWAMNQHGIELWSVIRTPALLDGHDRDHGLAHLLLGSLLGWILPASVRPWGASVIQGVLAAIVLGSWVQLASGRRRAGLAAAVLFTVAPWHLKLLPSLSGYVTASLGFVVAMHGQHLLLRSGATRDALLFVGGALLATNARADAALLAPFLLLVVGLPERGIQRPMSVGSRVVVGVGAVVWACRVVGALSGRSPEPAPWQVEHLRALMIMGVLASLIVLLAPRRLPPVVAVAGGVVGYLVGVAWAPRGFDGTWWAPPEPLYGVLRVWPQLHPWVTPGMLVALAFVGLAVVAGTSRVVAMGAVVVQLGVSAVHFVGVGEDGVSFYVRVVALTGWAWAGLAGLGWARATRWAGTVPLGLHAVALALFGFTSLVSTRDLLAFEFPTQSEARILFDHVLVEDGPVVVTLGRSDVGVPAEDLTPPWPLDLAAQSAAVGGPRVVDVAHALAHPEQVIGGTWWRSLDCVRVGEIRSGARATTPGGTSWVVGAGRVWRQPPPPRVADPPARPASPAWVRLVDLPCLVVPDAGVCVVEDLGGDCLAWSCPEDVELPAGARYQEPACAAFERAFELEPIRAVRTSEGSLDSDRLQPLVQAPRIGAYRILAVRPDPDGR